MAQCEMCGAETSSPKTAKIEGAELRVCENCAEFGTEIRTADDGATSAKYSTSSTESASSGTTSSSSTPSRKRPRRDMFDEMDEIAEDYDRRIRDARESAGLTQAELADNLNEKTSFIRKLERGESLPNDSIRRKLERALDISLLEAGAEDEEAEWSGGESPSGVTLGDVVKRKD